MSIVWIIRWNFISTFVLNVTSWGTFLWSNHQWCLRPPSISWWQRVLRIHMWLIRQLRNFFLSLIHLLYKPWRTWTYISFKSPCRSSSVLHMFIDIFNFLLNPVFHQVLLVLLFILWVLSILVFLHFYFLARLFHFLVSFYSVKMFDFHFNKFFLLGELEHF